MASIGPTDALPGNLSAQQQFILAMLAIEHEGDSEGMEDEKAWEWRHREELEPIGCSYRSLTLAVAREFDDGEGSRLGKRDVHSPAYRRSGTPEVTDQHRSSFAASVRRLEERGYLVRWSGRCGEPLKRATTQRRNTNTKYVVPTDRGLRAGHEAIRRHQDGRYNLEFSTLSEFDDELPD